MGPWDLIPELLGVVRIVAADADDLGCFGILDNGKTSDVRIQFQIQKLMGRRVVGVFFSEI